MRRAALVTALLCLGFYAAEAQSSSTVTENNVLQRRISIHLRDAYDDAVRILREENASEVGGVIHCFSGDRANARAFLDLGFDLSFSGVVNTPSLTGKRPLVCVMPMRVPPELAS